MSNTGHVKIRVQFTEAEHSRKQVNFLKKKKNLNIYVL